MITKDHLRALQWAAERSRKMSRRCKTPGIHLHRAEHLEELARAIEKVIAKPRRRINIETTAGKALD